MKKIFLLIYITTIIIASASAQNGKKAIQILDQASKNFIEAGGVKAIFDLTITDFDGATSNINGKIFLKGRKFRISIEEMTAWFDGNNQWVFLKNTNEVNVSTPSEEELLTVNPINIFELYKHGFTGKYMGKKKEKGGYNEIIELIPPKKYNKLKNIAIYFNRKTLQPKKILIRNKDDSGTSVYISDYKTGINFADTTFRFNPDNFPDTEIIDLRN